jgi:hypothetical protein
MVSAGVLLACFVAPALADWYTGEPFKWVQLPDLHGTGIGVNATDPTILADDYLCRQPGLITGIHVWGSWYDENVAGFDPGAVSFILSIHSDIPDTASGTGYSMPGDVLWYRYLTPSDFTVHVYEDSVDTWWQFPPDCPEVPIPRTCYQYNFTIDPRGAFFQHGSRENPVVYWLDLQAIPQDATARFGWWTSLDHWNDDAVWGTGSEPYSGPWNELRYHPDHPLWPDSMDLAFVITQEEGPDMKWFQLPDLHRTGLDVNATQEYILADDFRCVQPTPVTDIHVWGSWYQDILPFQEDPAAVDFILSFHRDIPADTAAGQHSMPGEPVWVDTVYSGEFVVHKWAKDLLEGWMDPPESYTFPGDFTCWRYYFHYDPEDAFYQQGLPWEPIVYWLDVQAIPHDQQARFGWKTSRRHWNDDAVWTQGVEPYWGWWDELRYPPGHQWYPESIDLAFALNGNTAYDLDWGDAPDVPYPTFAMSDGPYHLIDPTIFLGRRIDPDVNGQPFPPALGDDNDGSDDDDGVRFLDPLVPGMPCDVQVLPSADGFIDAWVDFNADGDWTDPGEQIFASAAVASPNTVLTFGVPAGSLLGPTFARFRFSTAGGLGPKGYAPDGEVEDQGVVIVEGETYKWEQRPDLDFTGIDVNATEDYILADDFLCTRPGRLTMIDVWGSWLYDYLPFEVDTTGVWFTLSIHEDIPASESPTGYSMPGDVLWHRDFYYPEYTVDVEAFQIEEGWLNPPEDYIFPADWTCYLYSFRIAPDEAFHQVGMPDQPVVYWLDVQAHPFDPDAFFGWKTSLDHWNDDAVWGLGPDPFVDDWYDLWYPPGHQFEGESIDLAFRLVSTFGTDVPDESLPKRFGVEQNTPNPFNPTTAIRYTVPAGGGDVRIAVYDVSGRLVRELVGGHQEEGQHSVVWDGRDAFGHELASGVYFYRFEAPGVRQDRKMVFLK